MFQIDPLSKIPVYEQIVTQLEKLVLSDVLKPGDAVPSVRSLSMQLKVNPNTIQKAYSELDQRGVICSVPGKGCFIAADARAALSRLGKNRLPEFEELCRQLHLSGVGAAELTEIIKKVYFKGDDGDDNG